MDSGIVLAGGKGSRMGGVEKPLINFRGKPLITYPVTAVRKVCSEIIVACRDEKQKELISSVLDDVTFSIDVFEGAGPLAGIHSGLEMSKGEYAFIVACDMPFIHSDVVRKLGTEAMGYDACLPVWGDGRYEPLFAVYRRDAMLKEVKKSLEKNETKILAPVFRLKSVKEVNVNVFRDMDPELRSFVNINTFYDMERYERVEDAG